MHKEGKFMKEVERFFANGGDATHLYNYNLTSDSIVLDIGGHEGGLTADMYKKFGCNIYVFEPIEEFYEKTKQRFFGIEKIKVFNYGIGDENISTRFKVYGESTSEYDRLDKVPTRIEIAEIKSFASVVKDLKLKTVDVCSINIEGGEYKLLPHIIDEHLSPDVKNFQIQFHDGFIIDAAEKRREIQKKLSKTHKITFNYNFVWENWTLK